jgi:uncharacterized protein YaiL (DUF2058 family)
MSPTITDEQRQAIAAGHGAPVMVVDAVSNSRYVLIPADAFERIRALFGNEDPFDISESYGIQDVAADAAWSHPDDAQYDHYDAHRKPV